MTDATTSAPFDLRLVQVDVATVEPRPNEFLYARIMTPNLTIEERGRIKKQLQEAVGPQVRVVCFEHADVAIELLKNPLRHVDEPRESRRE